MALTDYSIDTSGTPEDVQRRQKLAEALMQQGGDTSPAAGGQNGGWLTGINRALAGALGGYQAGQARQDDQKGRDSVKQQIATQLMGPDGNLSPQGTLALASNPYASPAQLQAVNHIGETQRQAAREKVADSHWNASFGLQKRAADRADEDKFTIKEATNPDGSSSFVRLKSTGPEGVIPTGIAPGAPAATAVTGPDGKPIEIPPGVDRKAFVHAVSTATANGMAGKFTETQGKANQFATRMQHAESTLSKMDGEGASLKGSLLDKVPGGNYLQSNNYQDYKQAEQEFVTALLRRESGAAIAHHEFDSYGKQFFPRPGDGPEVIAQKRQARWNALNSMKSEAGPAYKNEKPLLAGDTSANVPETSTSGDPVEAEMRRRGLLK